MRSHVLVLALLCSPASALAQGLAGGYDVQGNEPGRGAYSGQVDLAWTGNDYRLVREVEYTTWTYQGRPVSTVWEGRATDAPAGLGVTLSLDRMGWAVEGAGIRRTPADSTPMAVAGTFQLTGSDLAGTFSGQGPPFNARTERWTRRAVAPPVWQSARRVVATHSPPPAWLKRLLFTLFASHHQNPWMLPYAGRPELQAAIHYAVFDQTDFALHRRRPDLVRVIGRVVDDLTCAEAIVKANAFGKTLRRKTDEAEREIPRFLDADSLVGRLRASGALVPNGDGAEWTGDYAFSQALRYRATGEPEALARVERLVAGLVTHIDITGQPGEFARTLRTALPGRRPSAPWRAGQGAFAGIEWMEGGNNDMLKGPVTGGIAALEVLPAGHPLLAEVARSVDQLALHSSIARDGKFNEELVNGVVSAIRGPGRARDRYLKIARNPFLNLYTVAYGAGVYFQGISDWSGSLLSLTGLIARIKLADAHGRRIGGLINRLGLRRSATMQRPVRRAVHALATAGLGDLPWPWPPYDASDAVWVLREMPYPRSLLRQQRALRADWCASPYPNLPWKFDWTRDQGRAQGTVAPPLFETHLSDFHWKSNPFGGLGQAGGHVEWSGSDYLMTYWLGRAYGVIGPND